VKIWLAPHFDLSCQELVGKGNEDAPFALVGNRFKSPQWSPLSQLCKIRAIMLHGVLDSEARTNK